MKEFGESTLMGATPRGRAFPLGGPPAELRLPAFSIGLLPSPTHRVPLPLPEGPDLPAPHPVPWLGMVCVLSYLRITSSLRFS